MTDKGYTLKLQPRDGYLAAFVSGPDDSVAISLRFLSEVAASCHARGFKRVLIVEDLEAPVTMAEMYEIAIHAPRLLNGLKVAFFDRHSAHNDLNLFAEEIAVEHGVDGRVFSDLADAERWIATTDDAEPRTEKRSPR